MRFSFIICSLLSVIYSQDYKLVVSILDFKGTDVSEKILKASYQRLETSLDNLLVRDVFLCITGKRFYSNKENGFT